MGQVLEFKAIPKEIPKKIIGYRMSFYTEEQIDLALLALNMFGFRELRYTRQTLKGVEPNYIKQCLQKLRHTRFLSPTALELLKTILENIEEIYDEKTG